MYLAHSLKQNQQQVAIAQFSIVPTRLPPSEQVALERELQLLKSLKYPHIPPYLGTFITAASLCLIQRHNPAPFLAILHRFMPQHTKQIALTSLGNSGLSTKATYPHNSPSY